MAANIFGRAILILLGLLIYCADADNCIRGQYNLTLLQSFSPWYTINDNTDATFHINLCDKLAQNNTQGAHNCPDGTSICAVYPNGTTVSYGNFTEDSKLENTDTTGGGSAGELIMLLKGQSCFLTGELYSTTFHFKCGKTLGHPTYLGDLGCSAHIEWESYIFCQNIPVPDKEVPCTVIKDGRLIDLSPLTKLTGGYLVDENVENKMKIFINVCRDITPGTASNDDTRSCPKGSGSCKIIDNNVTDYGQPVKGLEPTPSGVRLVYTSPELPGTCLDNPVTTINFRCPERGGSKDPVLLYPVLMFCNMEIEWVTEFACPADHISSKTCQLTMEQHNIDIDLTPLKNPQFDPYIVTVVDGKDHYQYLINVCDTLGTQCGSTKGPSVCQKKVDDAEFHRSAGEYGHMNLRYSDGKLTMTMKNGDACSSNYRRDTMIEFFCNKTADNNGKGYPEFVEHSNCSYFFKWGTKHACPSHLMEDTCGVSAEGKKYDLSSLVRKQDTNWQVITGDNENEGHSYFLNVCHDVLNIGEASVCPPGSAVCKKGPDGAVSLGRYTQHLEYDGSSKSLRLHYVDGDVMKETKQGCKSRTIISFHCAPGKLDSAPQLVHKSEDDCFYEIEWYTAAACVLSQKTGDNCKVSDEDAGYTFDLTPLTYPPGQSYAISGGDGYNYLINVCAELHDKNYCITPPHDNAAICQVKQSSPSEQKKIGSPASKLEYFDGVLNLTYTNGEPYNNPEHTPRMAEIAFICDLAVGRGLPEMLVEKNLTYAFLWRTSYACPTVPTECVITDATTHKQYDLSSLTRSSENWQIESTEGSATTKFYINVCQPLRPIQGVLCSPYASVCATRVNNGKETLFHGNLGRFEAGPALATSSLGINLIYTTGDSCNDTDGTIRKFQTVITFICPPEPGKEGPLAPKLVSPCKYSIMWHTGAACQVSTVVTKDASCSIKDPNSGFVFSLMPLYKPDGYEVKALNPSKSYKVNICGGLPESVCGKFENKSVTVCELGNTSIARAGLTMDLEYSSQGQITLTYQGAPDPALGGGHNHYTFNFICDRTAQASLITFDSQFFLSTTFKVRTALACAPLPVSCIAQDSLGRQFDLSSLARQTGNWVVIDTRPSHKDLSYHINVCRPVNPTPEMTCPGGAVGGCQTGGSGNFSLGYVQSEPVVSSIDGVLTLHYEGGDKCHAGTPNERARSTRIIFFCDHVEHEPIFQDESSTCEYTFVWKTPSACPQKLTTGSNCKVTDPLYNFEFDLSTLRKTSDNYIVPGNGYQFLLNVCGPLVNGPGLCGAGQISACQTGSTLADPVQLGVSNDQPIYNSGQISLVYSQAKGNCHGNFTKSTVINFICDHSKTGNSQPVYVDEKSDCTYMFEWHTSVVCPPHQISDCTIKNGNNVYDLSRLSRVDGNYERVLNDSHKSYIINVCRSLVHTKGQTCPHSAAACEIDLTETDPKKRFHNIGEVTSQSLSIQGDTLILEYSNGELCKDGKTRRSTMIIFYCSQNTDAFGTPSKPFMVNECQDHFVWTSFAACPLVKKEDETGTNFGNCQVANPNTGYMFDLSSLKDMNGYRVFDQEGHEFILNVCGWVNSSAPCKNGTGSCQVEQSGDKKGISAGNSNANLIYRGGVLMLKYEGGESCGANQTFRTTYINFVCVPGAGKGYPVYIDKSGDCLYYFDWQTQLACENEVSCEVTTDTGNTLDLSPLIKTSGKYSVMLSYAGQLPGTVFINLCRPLNPIFGTLCPAGSGACLVRPGDKPLSLGRIDTGPVWDTESKHIKITYPNGDPCPLNPKVNMTSVILLKCSIQEMEEPQLESVLADCEYLFLWETPKACAENKPQRLTSNCTYFDHTAKMTYDFSSLSDQVKVKSSHGGTFNIKVCGRMEDKGEQGSAACAQSSVCLVGQGSRDGSYGNSSQGIFQKDSDFLGLTFSQKRNCTSGSFEAVSTINFICDRNAGKGTPQILEEGSDCEVFFLWKTSLVCPVSKKECHLATLKADYDFTFLSWDTGSWNFTDTDGNQYWLNLCQAVHGSAITAGCSDRAAVCRKTFDGKVQTLGLLETQNISSTDDPTPTITFQFTEGDSGACHVGRRRRSDLVPKVLLKMTCGGTTGSPVFRLYSSDCEFEFTWSTIWACGSEHKRVPVLEKNGLIIDSRTMITISLGPLITTTNFETTMGNKKYLLRLGGPVILDHMDSERYKCEGAAVCQIDLDTRSHKNLGNASSRINYLEDGHLEIVFTSSEKCEGSSKKSNVTTKITFTCKEGEAVTKPEFLDQMSNCEYVFNWDTSLVCFHAGLTIIQPNSSDSVTHSGLASSIGIGGTKIAIGLSFFLAMVVACILAVILHKPERRAMVGSKLKGLILFSKSQETPIVYSRLSQSEQEETIINDSHDPFNPFNETEEESELNSNHLPVRVAPKYRDDSDDDMLL